MPTDGRVRAAHHRVESRRVSKKSVYRVAFVTEGKV